VIWHAEVMFVQQQRLALKKRANAVLRGVLTVE
jgi:hypothetical protein